MIYTIEKANLVADQLAAFSTSYAHHVAGQSANMEFWMTEVEAALEALSRYNRRFNEMKRVQRAWVEDHSTKVHPYCPLCGGKCELSNGAPTPPTRTSNKDIEETKRKLSDAAYAFLLRCHRQNLLSREGLEALCRRSGNGLDPADLKTGK